MIAPQRMPLRSSPAPAASDYYAAAMIGKDATTSLSFDNALDIYSLPDAAISSTLTMLLASRRQGRVIA